MSALFQFSVKQTDGSYKNYTGSISDETNKFGQNVSVWVEQTKEEREAKKPKNYIGNGKVIWNDGKITNAVKQQNKNVESVEFTDLPF